MPVAKQKGGMSRLFVISEFLINQEGTKVCFFLQAITAWVINHVLYEKHKHC